MTQYPEAYLARELGMHYAGIALVTDYDTGVEHDPGVAPVTQEQVFAFFEENLHRVRALLRELLPELPPSRPAAAAPTPSGRCTRSTLTAGRAPVDLASTPDPPVRAGDDRRARGLAGATWAPGPRE